MYECPLCLKSMPESDRRKHENFECEILLAINGEEGLCQYCDLSLPFYLLDEHELTHGEVHLFENNVNEEILIPPKAEKIEPVATKIVSQERPPSPPLQAAITTVPPPQATKTTAPLPPASNNNTKTESKVIEETVFVKPSKVTNTITGSKQKEITFKTQAEEYTTKTGEKLLVYGTDMDPVEDVETDKESFKMPNNPLLSSDPKEDTIEEDNEDINNLSDDDCDESLEEFWKRASDFLKKNRGKIANPLN